MKLGAFKNFISKSFVFIGKKLSNIKGFGFLGKNITKFGEFIKRFSGFWESVKTYIDKIYKVFIKFQRKSIGYARILSILSTINSGIVAKITVFLKFFKIGFDYLGKPLQYLISAFVFVKAFMKSKESTFVGKLNDAVKAVIIEFFEMPIRTLAWIFEYIANKFGYNLKNTGDKWMEIFDEFTDNIFAPFAMFKFLLNRIDDVIDDIRSLGNTLLKIWLKIKIGIKYITDILNSGTSKIIEYGSKVTKFVKKVGSFLNKFLKIGKILPDLLGKFVYPITILLSIFDFVSGFLKSESDTFLGKVHDGVKNVILNLIELPIMLLGWLIEKIANLFGVEVSGVGIKILKFVDDFLDLLVWPIKMVYKIITTSFKGWLLVFKTILNLIWKTITGIFTFIVDGVKALFTGGVSGLLKHFGNYIGSIWKNIKDAWVAFFEVIAGLPKTILNWALNKLPGGKIIKKFFATNEKNTKATKESGDLVKGVFNGLKSFFGINNDDNKSGEANYKAIPTTSSSLGTESRNYDTQKFKTRKKSLDQQQALNDNLTSQINNTLTNQNNGNVTINNIDNSSDNQPPITTDSEILTINAFNTTYGIS
jgi:hypothetical protein